MLWVPLNMGMSAAHCQGNVREFQYLESGHPVIYVCVKAKLVQDTYVCSVIESIPQLNGVIDVSLSFVCVTIRYMICTGKLTGKLPV